VLTAGPTLGTFASFSPPTPTAPPTSMGIGQQLKFVNITSIQLSDFFLWVCGTEGEEEEVIRPQ
jgi:hypothetical protein